MSNNSQQIINKLEQCIINQTPNHNINIFSCYCQKYFTKANLEYLLKVSYDNNYLIIFHNIWLTLFSNIQSSQLGKYFESPLITHYILTSDLILTVTDLIEILHESFDVNDFINYLDKHLTIIFNSDNIQDRILFSDTGNITKIRNYLFETKKIIIDTKIIKLLINNYVNTDIIKTILDYQQLDLNVDNNKLLTAF